MNLGALNLDSPLAIPLAASRGPSAIELANPDAFIQTMRSASSDSREKACEAATSFVASAFLMPILATLHDPSFELKPPFAPGIGEQRFAPLLDQHLSERIARASNFPLVDAIVDRFAPADSSRKELVNVRA